MNRSGFPTIQFLPPKEYHGLLVRRIVEDIRRYCLQPEPVRFDPKAAAAILGARVVVRPLPLNCFGTILVEDDVCTIELSAQTSDVRRRFTLAHELAHLCFLELDVTPAHIVSPGSQARRANRIEEHLCNAIANELLLPARSMTNFVHRTRQRAPRQAPLQLYRQVAAEFLVTTSIAETRVRELGLSRSRRRRAAQPFTAQVAS